MKALKNFTLYDLLPFLMVCLLDRFSKMWALDQASPWQWSVLHTEVHFNHGVILGALSNLPQSLKVVFLSTLGAFILCSYIFIRLIVPMQSALLKMGLALVVAGILGNVTDRMIDHGGVVDFLSLHIGSGPYPVWNLADFFQIIGYLSLSLGLWKDSKHFWPPNDFRKTFWVMPAFQSRFCLQVAGIGLSYGLITSVMAYMFMKSSLESMGSSRDQIQLYLKTLAISLGFLQFALTLMVLVLGNILSHKIAGPIYAIHRYLLDTLKFEKKEFKLRNKDEFKELEKPLSEVNKILTDAHDIEKEAA